MFFGGLLLSAAGSTPVDAQQRSHLIPERLEITSGDELAQPFLYTVAPQTKQLQIRYRSFQYRSDRDSILVCSLETKPVVLTSPNGVLRIVLKSKPGGPVRSCYVEPAIREMLGRFETLPPGSYHNYLQVSFPETTDSSLLLFFAVEIDSNLAVRSKLRHRFNQAFAKTTASSVKATSAVAPVSEEDAALVAQKLQRKAKSLKGVYTQTHTSGGTAYSELYYQSWFLGRYPLANLRQLQERATAEVNAVRQNVVSGVQNELRDFESVGSQMRRLFEDNSKKELTGDIDINFNTATGRDPYSAMEPTYMDAYGLFATEVKNIPVAIEGYYTTQDRNRQAKASYFRIRYDVEAAKEKLAKIIQGYRGKFDETAAKGAGLQSVYRQYSQQLQTQALQLVTQTAAEYQLQPEALKDAFRQGTLPEQLLNAPSLDTSQLLRQATAKLESQGARDSATRQVREQYRKAQQKLQTGKAALAKKQQQYQELSTKIEKYNRLLDQYRDLVKLDSLATYQKLAQLKNADGVTYRQMAKSAEGLLPDGKVRTFISGLTHLEAGIMSRYESAYTLAGQTMKGGAVGYDFGLVKASISLGSVEYVSRDGSLDKYAAYMGRLDFKEYGGQKTGLVYYGYSPTRQILESTRFQGNIDAALPTFSKPIHILSLVHSGRIGRNLGVEGEAAASQRQSETAGFQLGLDNMAVRVAMDYRIPATSIGVTGSWEHLGKEFENKSLPLTRSGTERYTAVVESPFFRQFLYLKVSWNYMIQQSTQVESGNTRWGFEARTKSKQFPSLLLAYKPFSTFRTVSDTLALPQRPLLGEVWMARGTYQIKRPAGIVHRFVASWNQNSSSGDSISYKSSTLQAGYTYTARKLTVGLTAGYMEVPSLTPEQATSGYIGGQSWFCNTTLSRSFQRVSVQVGQELAMAPIGLQKIGLLAGGTYQLQKTPVLLRLAARYSRYRLQPGDPYGTLLAVQVGFGWRFRYALSHNEESF